MFRSVVIPKLLAAASAVAAVFLLSMMDGAATTPPTRAAQEAAFLAGDGMKVLYRPQAAPSRAVSSARPVAAETAAAIVGRTEAEIVARLGRPSREQIGEPGKMLRYDVGVCVVEVHLFPDTNGGMRALDVLASGPAECGR